MEPHSLHLSTVWSLIQFSIYTPLSVWRTHSINQLQQFLDSFSTHLQVFGASFSTHLPTVGSLIQYSSPNCLEPYSVHSWLELWTIWSLIQNTILNWLEPHSVHISNILEPQLFGSLFNTQLLLRASFSTHLSVVWNLIQYTHLNCLEPNSVLISQLFGTLFSTKVVFE